MPRVRRWWGGAAWWLSGLLHGLLALLIWRARAPHVVESSVAAPIEIELDEVARPRPDRAVTALGGDPPSGHRAESRDVSSRRPAVDSLRSNEVPRSDPLPGPAPDRGSPAVRASTSKPAATPAPNLSFGGLATEVQARLSELPTDDALAGGTPKASVDRLRAESERQQDAIANVEAGRVDPLLYDYLRGARVRLEDEAKRIAEALPVDGTQALRGWARGLERRVDEIHRGDRVADQVQPDLRDEAQRRRPDLAAAYDENRRQAEAGAEIRRTEICLDVAPGHETTTTLRRGSGNAALDRVALDAFARAVALQPVPADARAGRACYEVRISAYRAGPAPGVSCDLDLFGKHGPACVWPTKKITTVTSQLSSVQYPAKPGVDANQSLLRGAR